MHRPLRSENQRQIGKTLTCSDEARYAGSSHRESGDRIRFADKQGGHGGASTATVVLIEEASATGLQNQHGQSDNDRQLQQVLRHNAASQNARARGLRGNSSFALWPL